ncbi:MAG: hypothetical protein ACYCZ2_07570 [Lutibacter sp.]
MSNLNKTIRILPIIGITLTLIGYLYLTVQTFNLNERKNVLNNEIAELESIKIRLTNEAKTKNTIINLQDKIISQSSDTVTVKKGIELRKSINEPIAEHFVVTKKENSSLEQAQIFEMNGFRYLLERDIINAIIAFRKSENSYNGFHQVYEIVVYLEKNRSKLSNENSELWREVYLTLLKDYSWRMPKDIKEKLTEITE